MYLIFGRVQPEGGSFGGGAGVCRVSSRDGPGDNGSDGNAVGAYCGNEDIFTDKGCSFGLLAGQIHPRREME